MLQHDKPDDWVVATGEVHSVREVIECIAKRLGVSLVWKVDTNGLEYAEDSDGRVWIQQSQSYMRPNDVTYLCGDSTKIRRELGWSSSVTFEDLMNMMVDSDRMLTV